MTVHRRQKLSLILMASDSGSDSQPLGEQKACVPLEPGRPVKSLRRGIFLADLEPQRLDSRLLTYAFRKCSYGFAQFLTPEAFADVELVQQGKPAMELQTEAEGQGEITGQLGAAKDEVNLS